MAILKISNNTKPSKQSKTSQVYTAMCVFQCIYECMYVDIFLITAFFLHKYLQYILFILHVP